MPDIKAEEFDKTHRKSPIKAIRAKCLDCCCGNHAEVKVCTAKDCPLFYFKSGRNPYRQPRELSEEQRQATAERFRKAREKKKEDDNDS